MMFASRVRLGETSKVLCSTLFQWCTVPISDPQLAYTLIPDVVHLIVFGSCVNVAVISKQTGGK